MLAPAFAWLRKRYGDGIMMIAYMNTSGRVKALAEGSGDRGALRGVARLRESGYHRFLKTGSPSENTCIWQDGERTL